MRLAALTISILLGLVAAAPAATLEDIGEFERPIFVSSDPTNPNRLLVVEREGRVIEAGAGVLADISDLVSCCTGERGLLSIAPAPDFAASARFYAAYTGTAAAGGETGDIHVDSFHRDAGGSLVRKPIFAVGHASMANHNGGQLQLGPDGDLYVSTGDGGGSGDPLGSGQSLDTLLGKILRVDPSTGEEPEIWSYGLRNPWRFSFDRASGDMVIADVGQGAREEVDLAPSPGPGLVGGEGVNYGWNCREGLIAFSGAPESCDGAGGFTDPVFDYRHTDPGNGGAHGCSITGGYVVRDSSLGDLYGRYVYADFCVGEIRSLLLPESTGEAAIGDRSEGLVVPNPTSFGEDSCGRIYVASNSGAVHRLVGATPPACTQQQDEEPPASDDAAPAPPAEVRAAPLRPTRVRFRFRTRGRALRGGRKLVRIKTRVLPCAGRRGNPLQLNRGGRRHARKRLNHRCIARFRLRIRHRSTFRALLPHGGYRSQVLTIALAKPRP